MSASESAPLDAPDSLLERVLAGWVSMLRGTQDATLRSDERADAERNLLRALFRAMRAERADEGAIYALTLTASRYGRMQPLHRVDPSEVTRQFGCLRREIARALTECETCPHTTLEALHRIDVALSVATLAVIRAGHLL